nr:hypothetical protein [Tsukamurella tyrosinosolvens]
MQQHARRGLVDVLCRRDELRARLLNREIDGDVVGAVTSEAIDLMDDDVVDRVVCDVAKHLLKLRAIGRLR